MKQVAARYPAENTVQVLYVEAMMDTQPWDYWEAGGTKPKGHGAEIVAVLETVLKRNPNHPGAIHLYIHAVEASTTPERALPYANRLGALMPGAGHIVHMPAHIYYRVGHVPRIARDQQARDGGRRTLLRVVAVRPALQGRLLPAQHPLPDGLGADGRGRPGRDRGGAEARRLDGAGSRGAVRDHAAGEGRALHDARAVQRAGHDPRAARAARRASCWSQTMYHYARAMAFAQKKDFASAQKEIDALAGIEKDADFKPFAEWGIPAKEIVQTARLVATGRMADAKGDLEGAARAYEDAVFIEDTLAYTEPPYWYYPVRQSLGAVRLRQGKLDEAEKAFRDSLGRVRNNGWALAGLAETYKRKGDRGGREGGASGLREGVAGRNEGAGDRAALKGVLGRSRAAFIALQARAQHNEIPLHGRTTKCRVTTRR